jgi:hypothetical protein
LAKSVIRRYARRDGGLRLRLNPPYEFDQVVRLEAAKFCTYSCRVDKLGRNAMQEAPMDVDDPAPCRQLRKKRRPASTMGHRR